MTATLDRDALDTLRDYCARYAVNRRRDSRPFPALVVAMSSTWVRNADGGESVAMFTSVAAAEQAIRTCEREHRATGGAL